SHRDKVLSDFRRAANVVRGHAIVVFRTPVADNVVAQQRKRNAKFAKRRQDTDRMSAAQNHPTYPVFPGKRLGQPKVSRRRGQVAAERDELQVPSVLIAVSLGAQQNTSLELIQVIAIAQNKRDDSILPGGGQIDPK